MSIIVCILLVLYVPLSNPPMSVRRLSDQRGDIRPALPYLISLFALSFHIPFPDSILGQIKWSPVTGYWFLIRPVCYDLGWKIGSRYLCRWRTSFQCLCVNIVFAFHREISHSGMLNLWLWWWFKCAHVSWATICSVINSSRFILQCFTVLVVFCVKVAVDLQIWVLRLILRLHYCRDWILE